MDMRLNPFFFEPRCELIAFKCSDDVQMPRMKKIAMAAVLLPALIWAGDYARLLTVNPRFGSVRTQRYFAVTLKNHKTEFMYDDPSDQSCVHSLFSHFGCSPCWYLQRHRYQRVDVNSGPPGPLF